MLDEYRDEQPVVYKILKNAIRKEKLSHAYLIETNGYSSNKKIAFAFAKMLLCQFHYTNGDKCKKCYQCDNIDKNCFSEFKIIETDGLWIKKEEIDQLKHEFSRTSLESDKKVYIINQAEKMNSSAANTLLKFLEEPEKGIIAILLTDNIYQMMDTIVSRCQILSLKQDKNKKSSLLEQLRTFTNIPQSFNEDLEIYLRSIIHFIKHFEKYGNETILNTNRLWHDIIKTREEILFAFDVMILYYKDIISYKISREILFFEQDEDFIKIAKKNTITQLSFKVKTLSQAKEQVKQNANINLLIDRIIIEMKRGA